jgi:hypothetical protein
MIIIHKFWEEPHSGSRFGGRRASRDRRRREANGNWNTTAVLIKKSKAGNDAIRSVYFFYFVVCSFNHV